MAPAWPANTNSHVAPPRSSRANTRICPSSPPETASESTSPSRWDSGSDSPASALGGGGDGDGSNRARASLDGQRRGRARVAR